MRGTVFFKQAELLLRILPLIHKEEAFALKGGTAINFFVQDLPRLSVDIDLTYLPLHERDLALGWRPIMALGRESIRLYPIPGDEVPSLSRLFHEARLP